MAAAGTALRVIADSTDASEFWFEYAAGMLELEPPLCAKLRMPSAVLSSTIPFGEAGRRIQVTRVQHTGIRGPYLTEWAPGPCSARKLAERAERITWTAALFDLPFSGGAAAAERGSEGEGCAEAVAAYWRHELDPLREVLWSRSPAAERAHALALATTVREACVYAALQLPRSRVTLALPPPARELLAELLRSCGCSISLEGDDLFECDVLVLAREQGLLEEEAARRLKARVIVECGGIQIPPSAERALVARGRVVVPHLLASAGDLILEHVERDYERLRKPCLTDDLQQQLSQRMARGFQRTSKRARRERTGLREAAYCEAVAQVARAERLRAASA